MCKKNISSLLFHFSCEADKNYMLDKRKKIYVEKQITKKKKDEKHFSEPKEMTKWKYELRKKRHKK